MSIQKKLPRAGPKKLVQGHGPIELVERVASILKENGWSWTDFITAALEAFIEEYQRSRK